MLRPNYSKVSRKVIIASEYVRAEDNSTGYFWERAIGFLHSSGLDVEVVNYTRIMSTRVRANSLLRLGLKIDVTLRLAIGVIKTVRSGDVVFCGTNPETLLPILGLVCKARGARLCVLVHDVFPENLVAAGVLSEGNLILRSLSAIYRRVYASFDRAIVIGRDMRELVDGKAGRSLAHTVHNWVNSDDVKPLDRLASGLIEKIGWKNRVVFQFFGNMGRLQDIDTLLEAMNLSTADNAAFLFAGSGIMRSAVEKSCSGRIDRHALPVDHGYSQSEVLSSCDIAIVCLDARMLGLGVPSKAYFSLAAGRPILAVMNEDAEVARLVTEESVGWHVPAGDPVALATMIDRIAADGRPSLSERCVKLSKTRLSAENALKEVRQELRKLLP